MAIFSSPDAIANVLISASTYKRDEEQARGLLERIDPPSAPIPYEDYFCSFDAALETIVTDFATDIGNVSAVGNPLAAIEGIIDTYCESLINTARASANALTYANADDRPLYWARIKMAVALNGHPLLISSTTQREALLKRFEDQTRGFTTIDFSAAPADTRRILVVGFDPFYLNNTVARLDSLNVNPVTEYGNIEYSNPGGAAALALHGETISDGTDNALIQGVILPVRYQDLDAGRIEELFSRFLEQENIADEIEEIIILGSSDAADEIWIDRFASRYRGGDIDNQNVGHGKTLGNFRQATTVFPAMPAGDPFYETSLPAADLLNAQANLSAGTTISFNQKYRYEDNLGNNQTYLDQTVPAGFTLIESGTVVPPNYVPTLHPEFPANIIPGEGSGGKYIFNEVFYRLSLLRVNSRCDELPVGSISLPEYQEHLISQNVFEGTPFDAAKTKTIIDDLVFILEANINVIRYSAISIEVDDSDERTHVIPSVLAAAANPYKHFCTAGNEMGDIVLKANICGTVPNADISWQATGAAITFPAIGADNTTASLTRVVANGQRIPVQLLINGVVVEEVLVWIIWASGTLTPAGAVDVDHNFAPTTTRIRWEIDFVWDIEPATIIPDTPADDVPDLTGPKTTDPPNVTATDVDVFQRTVPLAGGATMKWDSTRHLRITVDNPDGLPLPAGDEQFITRLNYPSSNIVGNDDLLVGDEDNDPYTAPGFKQLIGYDGPNVRFPYGFGAVGNTFERHLQFREYARVELDGNWYKISDFELWRFDMRVIKASEAADTIDYNGDGDMTDEMWIDNGSIFELNNDDFN